MTREEAIEVYNGLINEKIKAAFEFFVPELRESEDERVRHALIEFLREAYSRGNAPEECAKWIVWLDQPKEQKPVEWSDEDEKFFTTALWHISYSASNGKSVDWQCDTTEWLKSLKERFKSLRPSWTPSEEMLDALDIVANLPELEYYGGIKDKIRELYKQLKKRYESTE